MIDYNRSGAIMDVGDWLRSLGLAQYEALFRENDIDTEVLFEADRERPDRARRVARAPQAATESDSEPRFDGNWVAKPATSMPQTSPDTAERRQLTVMFCDLVGSTALSARLDPEDLREIIGAYHRAVADTVARFDGFVAKYMGDGVLIYFGYPRAHEDDAERAVRGARGPSWRSANCRGADLSARVGIATGLVVVGDLIGEGAARRARRGRRDAEPRGPTARPRRARTRWSSPRARAGRSAGCSTSPISVRRRSPALPSRSPRGGSWARAAW